MWPTPLGAKNWPHAAFNPETGLLYANTLHQGALYKHLQTKPLRRRPALHVHREPADPEQRRASRRATSTRSIRSPASRSGACRSPTIRSGRRSLATGGGLLFTGKETGEFIALDIDNGKTLWQFQTGSGINAQPVTYTHNGKQYVTVLSGVGGLYWNVARDQLKDTVPQGGSVWTFALMD